MPMKDLPVPHAEIDAKVRIDLIRAIHERTAPPLIVGMLLSVLLAMLLEPLSGAATLNLISLVHRDLRMELRAALRRASQPAPSPPEKR